MSLTEKKSAAFLNPICLVWIISMACSKASSSDILDRSIEMRWNSKPDFRLWSVRAQIKENR